MARCRRWLARPLAGKGVDRAFVHQPPLKQEGPSMAHYTLPVPGDHSLVAAVTFPVPIPGPVRHLPCVRTVCAEPGLRRRGSIP